MCWVAEDQTPQVLVRQGHFEPKATYTIFFKSTGALHISYLEREKTIDHKTFIICY